MQARVGRIVALVALGTAAIGAAWYLQPAGPAPLGRPHGVPTSRGARPVPRDAAPVLPLSAKPQPLEPRSPVSSPNPTASARTAAEPLAAPPTRRPLPSPANDGVWTADDLEALRRRRPISVLGSAEGTAAPPAEVPTTTVLASPPKSASAERARELEQRMASLEARIQHLDLLDHQWQSVVLNTGQFQREAAHELSRIRRERTQAAADLARARSDLLGLDEAAP